MMDPDPWNPIVDIPAGWSWESGLLAQRDLLFGNLWELFETLDLFDPPFVGVKATVGMPDWAVTHQETAARAHTLLIAPPARYAMILAGGGPPAVGRSARDREEKRRWPVTTNGRGVQPGCTGW